MVKRRKLGGRQKFSKKQVVPTNGTIAKSIRPIGQPLGNTSKQKIGSEINNPGEPMLNGAKVGRLAGIRK